MSRLIKTHTVKAHKDSAICCTVSKSGAKAFSGGEDGNLVICTLEPACISQTYQISDAAVTSVCCSENNEDILYAAAGTCMYVVDCRCQDQPQRTFDYNKEEVNSVSIDSRDMHLVAGDDAGDIKVVDLAGCKLFKGIRTAHSNICSVVAVRPGKPWHLVSGGLDLQLKLWDYSRGRCVQAVTMQCAAEAAEKQVFNPPLIHSISLGSSADSQVSLVAAARGDGAVALYRTCKPHDPQRASPSQRAPWLPDMPTLLTQDHGGHTRPVSCVRTHSPSSGHDQLISGGEDKRIIVWSLVDHKPLCSHVHGKKINALAPVPAPADLLVVADTSKSLTFYKCEASLDSVEQPAAAT